MTYQELRDFLQSGMRMSHVYQPVMLLTLLEKSGSASVRDIAGSILVHDESQIEYYEQITKQMVGRVLTKRGVVQKEGGRFDLPGFASLTPEEVSDLASLCRQKLELYKQRRGKGVWSHRKKSDGYVSGTLRYEVLKRAKFRCELCGVSAAVKALEVDHILPRNHGGTDDESNLQSLCYSCNAMKRDRDSTDFRQVAASYAHRVPACPFCTLSAERVVAQNELCVAVADKYPVTAGHHLVIPRRHVADYFELGRPELNAVHFLLEGLRKTLREGDPTVTGFNVGVNCGAVAGQTVHHCHVHLIPRRVGDVENPAGGVRHTIPGKGHYHAVEPGGGG